MSDESEQPCSTFGISSIPPERPIPTPDELRDLILYWVADGRDYPTGLPSEAWMAQLTGLSRETLRTMRDDAFARAQVFVERYYAWRRACSSSPSKSSAPLTADGG